MSYIGTEPKDIRSFGRTKFDYTASQGQTAFTGADDDGKVLAFTVGQIEVYVNGILMDDSDFTTTGTGTVTLASAANLNDVINIVSFETNIPDSDYVPASGGTFTGNVTHSGTVTNSGNVTVGGTLGVTGATTMSADLTARRARSNTAGDTALTIHPSDTTVSYGMRIDQNTNSLNFDQVNNNTTKMSIDTSGRVTIPNQPSFSAYRDAGHVTSGNVFVFDHTDYNIGNMYNTSNGKATVPVDGRYFLGVWLMTNNDATYDNKYFRIRINNASPAYRNVYSSSGGSYHHQFSWAGVLDLNANDYVEIYIDNFTAYGVDNKYSLFSMHLLS